MRGSILSPAILVASVLGSWAPSALAYLPASDAAAEPPANAATAPSPDATAPSPDATAPPATAATAPPATATAAPPATAAAAPSPDAPEGPPHEAYSVDKVAGWRGFIFYPSTPPRGTVRFAMGANYDAIDPQVMYGTNIRLPQLTLDATGWLGNGWSLKGHINTMLILNELLFGAGYTVRSRPWSFELDASAGVYLGSVGAVIGTSGVAGFKALFISPEYRPELTIGYDFGKLAVSLRGTLMFMGPMRAKVGDVWGGFDNSHFFAGHSEMLYVENTTRKRSVWYFGAGAMTTRSYYALWLLFPDSPSLYTYPRMVVGYEY
jgi:hypothetical protein